MSILGIIKQNMRKEEFEERSFVDVDDDEHDAIRKVYANMEIDPYEKIEYHQLLFIPAWIGLNFPRVVRGIRSQCEGIDEMAVDFLRILIQNGLHVSEEKTDVFNNLRDELAELGVDVTRSGNEMFRQLMNYFGSKRKIKGIFENELYPIYDESDGYVEVQSDILPGMSKENI